MFSLGEKCSKCSLRFFLFKFITIRAVLEKKSISVEKVVKQINYLGGAEDVRHCLIREDQVILEKSRVGFWSQSYLKAKCIRNSTIECYLILILALV